MGDDIVVGCWYKLVWQDSVRVRFRLESLDGDSCMVYSSRSGRIFEVLVSDLVYIDDFNNRAFRGF
jgi:hypothetical protein